MKGLRMSINGRAWALALPALLVTGCMTKSVAPPPPSPDEMCRTLHETLQAAVPPGESLAELQVRGVRVRTPLSLPPGAAPSIDAPSGAVVRAMIQADGSVVAGSPRTLKSLGEPQFASAVEAGALSMSFDFDSPARLSAPIPFTTTLASCGRAG